MPTRIIVILGEDSKKIMGYNFSTAKEKSIQKLILYIY